MGSLRSILWTPKYAIRIWHNYLYLLLRIWGRCPAQGQRGRYFIFAVARNGLTTGATQGRLLFPAIGALSILMVSGWHDVLPERYKDKLPWFVIALMFLLNITLWIFGILPVYFQPFLD